MKVGIDLKLIGQWGNQVSQYVFAKILADRTGLPYTPPQEFVDKHKMPVQWHGPKLFEMVPSSQTKLAGTRSYKQTCGNWVRLDEFRDAGAISLRHGYYQRYEYYRPYKDVIRNEWLRLLVPLVDTDPNAVYIHVRRRDYIPTKDHPVTHLVQPLATTMTEYARCLEFFPEAKRLVICTDDVRDPFLYEFSRFGKPVTINGGTWDTDLLTLLSCDNLLMSQSTFSWWAGFLGRANRIVCPVFAGTHWRFGLDGGINGPPTNGDFPSLCVDDDPRWIWVKE